jgi:hypothetical protein
MNTKKTIATLTTIGTAVFCTFAIIAAATFAQDTSSEKKIESKKAVTVESFVEAEVDARIFRFIKEGGMNKGFVVDKPTPTDRQAVPRQNRDTLYRGIPIDTSKGYSISIPKHSDDRYVSVYVLDNDHMTLHILKGSGVTHTFKKQEDTRYIVAIPRVQVFDPADKADVTAAASILHKVKVESGSKEPKPMVNWDWEAMMKLRAQYEKDFRSVTKYPSDFQGKRGTVDRYKGHNMAVATSWGLFPSSECVYIAQNPGLDAKGCFSATYKVPSNDAFWSITVYNGEGYLFSDNNTLNNTTAKYNEDGTVTVYYGSEEDCGKRQNRLDITKGWNILMRVYVPGQSVIDGKYKLPKITESRK